MVSYSEPPKGGASLTPLCGKKRVGGCVDAHLPISSLDELPPSHIARRNFKNSVFHRCLSCFRRGFLVIKAAILNRVTLPGERKKVWESS